MPRSGRAGTASPDERGQAARPSAPGYPPGPVKNRSALAILFVIVFIDLPLRDGHPGDAAVRGAARRVGGLDRAPLGGYSAMQFVFAPIWGRLSDRIGRRPMLLASIAMTAVAFCAHGLADSFSMLLVSRLFAGAATANIAIARVRST